jgi:hypothetical protein
MVAENKSSKEIGAELSIHYRTVENDGWTFARSLAFKKRRACSVLRFSTNPSCKIAVRTFCP